MSDGFREIVDQASPHIRQLAEGAKALIEDVYPQVVEVAWTRQRIIGYGVGPRKMSEQFCYIALQKNHINLGFYYGSQLPDPNYLLEGTGQLLRHIKIRKAEQLEDPAVRALVEAASKHLPRLKK
jgi:hypothetical protein